MLIDCDSRITAVAIHARGALVTRRVSVPDIVPDGELRVAVRQITALAEPGSLRASLGPEARERAVSAVRSEVHWPEVSGPPGDRRTRVDALRSQQRRSLAEHALLITRRDQLAGMTIEPSLRPTLVGPPIDARTLDALACSEALSALLSDHDARAIALEAEIETLGRQIQAAELELSQATSAQRDRGTLPTRSAVVHLHGRGIVGPIELTYAVHAARWWPVYTLRLTDNARRATWVIEALVAQLTREDWSHAKLSLSTADLLFDARMPVLPSLRLGRAQSPVRRDYRAPPPGLDRMFQSYDRALSGAMRPTPPEETLLTLDEVEAIDEQSETDGADFDARDKIAEEKPREAQGKRRRADEGGRYEKLAASKGEVSGFAPKPRPALAQPDVTTTRAGSFGGAGSQESEASWRQPATGTSEEPIEPSDGWLDFDALVLMGPEPGAQRGRLAWQVDSALERAKVEARLRIEHAVHHGVTDPTASRGMFDHRYETQGSAEIPSDGRVHRVMVGSAEAVTAARWRTVPRESPEVFREVELKNPFSAPLLAGPVEVYSDGSLLTVASIARIDRGGSTRVGMGVDPRVRVARNARMHEETAGILGGSTLVDHTVSIEVSAPPGLAPCVDVVDRVPVTDDKSVEVSLLSARPEARPYNQSERGVPLRGGLLWTLNLPAGGRSTVEFSYRVTLPSKTEVVGGNRRD